MSSASKNSGSSASNAAAAAAVDENLYSRQLFVFGHAAQARMASADILICGLQGLGAEIAKNIILMGVRSVTLYDPNPASFSDLSAQFYLTESDVGKPRAAACVAKLAELNNYVSVKVHDKAELTLDDIRHFQVVVAADQPLQTTEQLGKWTRSSSEASTTRFVAVETRGVYGRMFSDFGPTFRVEDTNGETPGNFLVATVSRAADADQPTEGVTADGMTLLNLDVSVPDDGPLTNLEVGDYVNFAEVKLPSALTSSSGSSSSAAGSATSPDEKYVNLINNLAFPARVVDKMDTLRCRVQVAIPLVDRPKWGLTQNTQDVASTIPLFHLINGWMLQQKVAVDVSFKPLEQLIGTAGSSNGPSPAELTCVNVDIWDKQGNQLTFEAGAALHTAWNVIHQLWTENEQVNKTASSSCSPSSSSSLPVDDTFANMVVSKTMANIKANQTELATTNGDVEMSQEETPTPATTRTSPSSSAAGATGAEAGGAESGAMHPSIKALVKQLGRCCGGQVSPLAAVMGGIAAQEVLKAVSGKFMPVLQWLYYQAPEALPYKAEDVLTAEQLEDFKPYGSTDDDADASTCALARYNGQIAVFGRKLQQKIQDSRYFLVGAGAIGCEMLKNWAMMGVGCPSSSTSTSTSPHITLTDMDHIERSNLSRQFLFRNDDIGFPKSERAAKAALAMNPSLSIGTYTIRAAPETETTFTPEFWNSLTGVCTALDNVVAREYIDSRCVYYRKHLVDSGTLGTKGNVQVVLPGQSLNYGATRDPAEKEFPVCTLKNFPNRIEHTLQWARDWFGGEFTQVPATANGYLAEGPAFLQQLAHRSDRIDQLSKLHSSLKTDRPSTVEDCINWARFKFQEMFNWSIRQLIFTYPETSTTNTGEPFWSGAKRFPTPLEFNAKDPLHAEFVLSVARIRAAVYSINIVSDVYTTDKLLSIASQCVVPEFKPQEGVKIAADDKELAAMKAEEEKKKAEAAEAAAASGSSAAGSTDGGGSSSAAAWDSNSRAAEIEGQLPNHKTFAGYTLKPAEFEKDDDLHIAVVTACSNLRARNYKIEEADKHKSKGIAGKIIPAIATTTAYVTGLVCLELYKILQNKPLDDCRDSFANLALPLFSMASPNPVKFTKVLLPAGATFQVSKEDEEKGIQIKSLEDGSGAREWRWSLWDRIDVKGPLTCKQFVDWIEQSFSVKVTMLSYGSTLLVGSGIPANIAHERGRRYLTRLCELISKTQIPVGTRYINLAVLATRADPATGAIVEVDLPTLRYELVLPEETELTAPAGTSSIPGVAAK